MLCVLYCDERENERHLRTHEIDLKARTMRDGSWWMRAIIDPQAHKLVAVPSSERGGVLVMGEHSVSYHSQSGNPERSLNVPSMSVRATASIDEDGSRFLIGDHLGGLHVLALLTAEEAVATDSERAGESISKSASSSSSDSAGGAAAARQSGKKRKKSSEPDDETQGSSKLVHELRMERMGEMAALGLEQDCEAQRR